MTKPRSIALCLRVLCLLSVTALFAAPALLAQEPQMFHVNVDHTKLGHGQDYEAAITKAFAAAKKGGFGAPIMASASTSNPGSYSYVVPFSDMTQLGQIYDTWNKITSGMPDVMATLGEVVESQETSIWTARADLSYTPASPRLSEDESLFGRVVWLYPHGHQATALESLMGDIAKMYESKGIDTGFDVFQHFMGGEGPAYAVALSGKNEADFFVQSAKIQEKLASDWQAMVTKMMPMLRRLEYTSSTSRPDLSLQP